MFRNKIESIKESMSDEINVNWLNKVGLIMVNLLCPICII